MKNFTKLLLMLGVSAMLCSCLKGTVDPAPNKSKVTTTGGNTITSGNTSTVLIGNWSIANDSTCTTFWGLWNGMTPGGPNYIGKVGDHYNFMANGKLYIKENSNSDTLTYSKMQSDTTIFTYPKVNGIAPGPSSYAVSNLTEHTMTLTSPTSVSPETISFHVINLKK